MQIFCDCLHKEVERTVLRILEISHDSLLKELDLFENETDMPFIAYSPKRRAVEENYATNETGIYTE